MKLIAWAVQLYDAVRNRKWQAVAVLLAAALGWLAARLPADPPKPAEPSAADPAPLAGPPNELARRPPGVLYFCGRVETMRDSVVTKPWPVQRITWTVQRQGQRVSLADEQIREAFDVAWKAWARDVDFEPVYTPDAARALVVSRFGRIDGSGRVLAWSELADGTTTTKEQLYDASESWEVADRPRQIDLVRVAAHEIGHVLGLVHDDQDGGALMAPVYSPTVRFPTNRDVKRLYAMGYAARPTTTPAPKITVTIDAAEMIDALRKAGYKVEPNK